MQYKHYLFDWGDTLMADLPGQAGPMCQWPTVKVIEGAGNCLSVLSLNASCHLATDARDSDVEDIAKALKRGGIDQFIEQIFCYRRIGCSKSEAAFYEHIVGELGVELSEIVMIGDSIECDVRVPKSIGMDAIWYNPELLEVPVGVQAINSLNELVDA
jgi:beta-phosphoglucomutase-like phosphatase (HAD superfamily)